MTNQTKITYNLKGLEDLKQKLGQEYRARVGVLGSNVAREEGPIDNATLGMIQQFGSLTKNIPPRDFLIMPIQRHGRELVAAMGKASITKAIAAGDIKKAYSLLGAVALGFVQQAFETSGFGQWAPNAPSTIRQKKSDRPLINTGQLRRAITNDVVKKSEAQGAIAHIG